LGSLAELETQLIISYEIGYLNREDFSKLSESLDTIRKMLKALANSLK
jgi:four helix bundle protein